MTEEDLIKAHTENAAAPEEKAGKKDDDGSDKDGEGDKAGEMNSAKKDYMKILKQIENKDQKVDDWILHKFINPAR